MKANSSMERSNQITYTSQQNTISGSVETSSDHANEKEEIPLKITFEDKQEKPKTKEASFGALNSFPKILRININLIPLKIAIFFWFAAGSAVLPFISVHLKQLGLTLKELSVIYVILPFIQFFGPTISGIVADKIGRSKPVLQANLLLTAVVVSGILLLPVRKQNSCNETLINCYAQTVKNDSLIKQCDIQESESQVMSCTFRCSLAISSNISDYCFKNYILECHPLFREDVLHNLTFPGGELENETQIRCQQKGEMRIASLNNTWCLNHCVHDCESACMLNVSVSKNETNCQYNGGGSQLFLLSLIFLIAYNTFLSNAYRIFDVTAMSMVKTFDSDFGRQRIWAIMGSMVSAPLAGYIITTISPQGGPQKYEVAFYMFDAMVLVTALAVWKLDITIEPPAKNMLKKTAFLLKNIDILMFILTILVSGTAWGFTRVFATWYLEDLGATSTLMGLTVAFGCVVGLPFLFTSNWFVEKIGSSNILVLCLVAYVAWYTGYSFLVNPWWALIYEIFGILTYHLLWVSVVRYSHTIAPVGLTATVISTAGGVHYGIGKGSGSLIGGLIMSKYGGRTAYRVMAAICAVTATMYALYLYCSRKHKNKETDLKYTER